MILVTGATGFIGSHLVARLTAQGWPVRCLVRRAGSRKDLPGTELARGDLATGEGLAAALRGVETVIHLAGVTKALRVEDYYTGNSVATANLVRAAGEVRRLVHVSSMAAAGPSGGGQPLTEDAEPHPVSHYGRSKLAGEQAITNSSLWERAIIVRPPVVYGPRDRDVYQVIRSGARGWLVAVGRVPRWFSLIYVNDLVDGLIAAAIRDGIGRRVFYMAQAEPVSWDQFAAAIARQVGRRVRTISISEGAAYQIARCAEWLARLRGQPAILSCDKIREACCDGWVCDATRACRELGFRARTDLDTGLRCTLDWYREAAWLKW
jgi:nucleoside-diphosphate-sugar epimerase